MGPGALSAHEFHLWGLLRVLDWYHLAAWCHAAADPQYMPIAELCM